MPQASVWDDQLTRLARRPPFRIPRIVYDCKYMHQVIFHREKHSVRKPRKQGPSNARHYLRIKQWRLLQPPQLQLKRRRILQTQSFTLRLIPFVCFTDLTNGPARQLQAECHDPFFSFSFT